LSRPTATDLFLIADDLTFSDKETSESQNRKIKKLKKNNLVFE